MTLVEALKAHEMLAGEELSVRVVDAYSVKPIDSKGLLQAARHSSGRLLVVEEHYYDGGLGDAVLNGVANSDVQVYKLAVTGIPRSGKPEELLEHYGISARRIVQKVKELTQSG
jgi:transketolase